MENNTESRAELFKALSKAQGTLENATRNATNPHFRSKYADLAECLDTAREHLAANGLCVIQLINRKEGGLVVETILGHSSGQSISSVTPIFCEQNMQKMGSSITYARRYSFAAIIGLSQVDDDAQASVAPKPQVPQVLQKKVEEIAPKVSKPVYAKTEIGGVVINPETYVFTTGKYTGKKLSDIPKNDLENYVENVDKAISQNSYKPTKDEEIMITNIYRYLNEQE